MLERAQAAEAKREALEAKRKAVQEAKLKALEDEHNRRWLSRRKKRKKMKKPIKTK